MIVLMHRSYDPDFQEWDFGKMSALQEISLAVEGQYDWYYMGMRCQLIVLSRE